MTKSTFGEVAEFINGRAFAPEDWSSSGLPIIRIQNLTGSGGEFNCFDGELNPKHLVKRGDMLISWSASLGVYRWKGQDAALNQHIFKVAVDGNVVDDAYFYFAAQYALDEMKTKVHGATMQHITKEPFEATEIFVPSLPNQRRIAAILEKADRVCRLRRYALELSEGYLQSVFLEMFGDLTRNEMGWKVSVLEEVGHVFGGLQLSASRERLGQKAPYLRVANVFRDCLDLDEVKTMGVTDNEARRTRMSCGDLLLVEGHGNLQEIGRCAIWDGSIEGCLHQNHLIRVRLDLSILHPVYASRYINSHAGRRYFSRHSNTTSGLNTINTSTVGSLPIHISPMPKQIEFESVVIRHERIRAQQREGLRQAEHLFQTLLYRAFSGGL